LNNKNEFTSVEIGFEAAVGRQVTARQIQIPKAKVRTTNKPSLLVLN
jgi:hypothetical protein